MDENGRRSPCPARPPAPPPALPGPPHPSPGTSRSFSPRACSWLAKLTNSSSQPPPPPDSGRFRRSLARARRAARSSRLRSVSAFRLPLPGRPFAACFRDMAATRGPQLQEGKPDRRRAVSGAKKAKRRGRRSPATATRTPRLRARRAPGSRDGPRPLPPPAPRGSVGRHHRELAWESQRGTHLCWLRSSPRRWVVLLVRSR